MISSSTHKINFRKSFFGGKNKKIDIEYLSEHFVSDDDKDWKPSVEKCKIAANEFAKVLALMKKRIVATDDFDIGRFLSDASQLLTEQIDTSEEWESIRSEAEEKRLAIRASKGPWDLLEIDWNKFHPGAREILDDPFFWESADDLAPNGNDTGADLLEDFRRWNSRHRKSSPILFLAALMTGWDIKPIDWSITEEETVLRFRKDDSIALGLCNEAAIALAFAVIKLRGDCPKDVLKMAIAALVRTAISVNHSGLCSEYMASWDKAIAKMRSKLESLLGHGPYTPG